MILALLLTTLAALAAPLKVTADVRDEYLAGEKLLVALTVANEGDQAVTVPDLAARHDLVKFELALPSGEKQTRSSVADKAAAGRTWTLPPRTRREVLLEIPSGGALSPGSYQLGITVQLAATPEVIPPRPVRLAKPAPAYGDLAAAALPTDRGEDAVLWLHQGTGGYDLYLHRPGNSAQNTFLGRFPQAIQPLLTATRPSESASRYYTWIEGGRTLRLASLSEEAAERAQLPWPKVELAGRGATVSGALYQPLWIPAPQGASGEIQVLVRDERGQQNFRRLARFDKRPALLETTLDDAGSVHFLVGQEKSLDLYTIRPGPAPGARQDLPVPGQRLLATPDASLVAARFAALPASSGQPGGLALLALHQQQGSLQARWIGLGGQVLATLPAQPWEAGSQLLDLSPRGTEAPGLLVKLPDGTLRYQEGARVVAVSAPSGAFALDRGSDGAPVLRQLKPRVSAAALKLPTQ